MPDEWGQHMGTIRRLYLDEDMTLQEVMRIMASEFDFVASYDQRPSRNVADRLIIIIRVKMYKKRLRDWKYRKNIRSTQSDAQACQNML